MLTLIISALACIGTITIALLKPQVKLKGYDLSIFFFPALLGALLLIFSGQLSWAQVSSGLTATADINPLKILVLFLSMTLISVFLDETGFFRYLANYTVQRFGGSQIKLFIVFYCLVSALTVFTSNDVVILTFTPFICYFTKHAKVNPIPYLVSEFVAANTASTLLIIGNPTNIYLGTMAGIDFLSYLQVMVIPTIFGVITAFLVLFMIFYKNLSLPINVSSEKIEIEEKFLLLYSLIVLSLCTLILTISSYIQIPMWFIALMGICILTLGVIIRSIVMLKKPVELIKTMSRTPWEVIPLVLSMFIIVLALSSSGITVRIADFLNTGNTIFTYGIAATIIANLMNNIPMSVLFSSVVTVGGHELGAVYAAVIGSNIGAYLTPIGALAGVMWLGILRGKGIDFGFTKFVMYGFCVAIPTLSAMLLGLYIVMKF